MSEFKVLFVDDERNVLNSFSRIFFNEPITIFTAESAEEALDIISSTHMDLIVTDIKMPNTHGFELIEQIRKNDCTTPVIIYSAFPWMKNDCIIQTHDIKAYYTKPDDYDLICAKIKEMASLKAGKDVNPQQGQDPC